MQFFYRFLLHGIAAFALQLFQNLLPVPSEKPDQLSIDT
jgi:hypothetical protein